MTLIGLLILTRMFSASNLHCYSSYMLLIFFIGTTIKCKHYDVYSAAPHQIPICAVACMLLLADRKDLGTCNALLCPSHTLQSALGSRQEVRIMLIVFCATFLMRSTIREYSSSSIFYALEVLSTNSYWYRKTLDWLKIFTCYLEPSVCWHIFCS